MWKNRKSDSNDVPRQSQLLNATCEFLRDVDPRNDDYATIAVDRMLRQAIKLHASDIHLDPAGASIQIRLRIDGVLSSFGVVPQGQMTTIANRLKSIAKLLTYRVDVPQEGRLAILGSELEARVVTLPTLHGERIVIRLANQQGKQWLPSDLGLPQLVFEQISASLAEPAGVVLFTGPAGSGKSTSAYACIRAIAATSSSSRSIVSLEDPIEVEIPNVAQSQIQPNVGYDWASGLKAILRQDPEVLLVGEIRDNETAQTVFQAAMTGQLVVSTMHARSACDGLRRLLDMRVPVHQIRSSLNVLVCQRLVRRLCDCRVPSSTSPVPATARESRWVDDFVPAGCEHCHQSGYRGRLLLAEVLPAMDDHLGQAICSGGDTFDWQQIASRLGMQTLEQYATEVLRHGWTTSQELGRL